MYWIKLFIIKIYKILLYLKYNDINKWHKEHPSQHALHWTNVEKNGNF